LPLLPGGLTPLSMHLMSELLWACLPYLAGLGYFPGSFGDKLKWLDVYLQLHCFWLPLGNYPFGCFSVKTLLVGAKRKRKKERRCVVFRNIYLYTFYSLL
jgi:hypothetical protein